MNNMRREDENRVWRLSLIPTLPILVILLWRFMQILRYPEMTLWQFWMDLGVLLVILMPVSMFVSFDVICRVRTKQSKFHFARLLSRIIITLLAAGVFSTMAFAVSYYIVPAIGFRFGALMWLLSSLLVIGLIAFKTRSLFRKLEMGSSEQGDLA